MAQPPNPPAHAIRKPMTATERPRKAKGGARPYRKGAEAERRAQRAYEAEGWLVTRQPKSQSPYDLMCINDQGLVDLVQVKSKGYLAPAERKALLDLVVNAYPRRAVLAWIDVNTLRRLDLMTGGELADLPCPR